MFVSVRALPGTIRAAMLTDFTGDYGVRGDPAGELTCN
jgi:hypothetical protein